MSTTTAGNLRQFIRERLANGEQTFTVDQATIALGLKRRAVVESAKRLQKKGQLLHPRTGFYVIVPPDRETTGGPPPSWYIDRLMQFEGAPYYVALLKAAEFHAATHQSVMEFQVVSTKRMRPIIAGRSRIAFYYRHDIGVLEPWIEQRQVDITSLRTSSVELTCFDLVRYLKASGGVDNVASLIKELAPSVEPHRLAALSSCFERSVGQRLGHLLSYVGHRERAKVLHTAMQGTGQQQWVELERVGDKRRHARPGAIYRDNEWQVIVRREIEVEG